MIRQIDSVHNPTIQRLRRLDTPARRREEGVFLCEGVKLTREALSLGRCRALFVRKDALALYAAEVAAAEGMGAEVFAVSDAVLSSVAGTRTPQALFCLSGLPAQLERLKGTLLLALDGVQDPGNLGTMLRTADAAGFSGALLGAGCADPCGEKAIRSTMGSIFRVPFVQTEQLPAALLQYREMGYAIVCSELGGDDFYAGCPSGKTVLVVGSEGRGISYEVSAAATHRLALPMRGGAGSLNAAVAAGIMMYECARRAKGG